MEKSNYANVRDLQNLPSFHDAELFRIEHRRDESELELGFKRVNGEMEVLLFKQVISLRMLDFAEQNVVSRVLLSPKHSFSVSDVRTIIGWIRSWTDSKPALVSQEQAENITQDILTGKATLFALDPSCGAEVAVLCESVWLRQHD
ncbi:MULTISPECIES: hypothetical protein [Paraburkholderia]|uniref:Uncharacterized protein n=1 Tax=Paraburkholderia tuberum TaxID=157910 RepID=A0A1H1F6U0_9BURK|nr:MULTISPECIES: hypothetical protein [Paraburkholderia]MBB5456414.1 hypothetical protein [Paraburkholderia sp. Cpub6]MBC8722784.1 hypothetical protein [Paraburkholderia sp. 31.1]SDQ96620.1 hypothetical protein SAMN05445850_2292 [Paraburkholderia tuberum]